MIFLNFKTYPETSGENTVKLCQLIKDKRIIPCLQAVDIYKVTQALPDLAVWAQHADPFAPGKFTGYQLPLSLKAAGASGVLLNHSDHSINPSNLPVTVKYCREAGLKIMVIAASLEEIKTISNLQPDFIGFEDSQLIGGPVAMIDAYFDLVKQAAVAAKLPLIVGGGIRSAEQVKKSLQAGGAGVLVASEFAKSSDPVKTLQDLIQGLTF